MYLHILQVLALYKSPDMLSVSYLEVNDLTRTVVESGEITLADIGVSPPITIGAEVEPFDGGVR